MPPSRRTVAAQPNQEPSKPWWKVKEQSYLTPYWQSECGRAVVYVGDNLNVMAQLEESQFHAVVTDPPYGLEFMGKEWDAPWKSDGGLNSNQSEDTTGRGSWAFGGTPSSKAGRPCYGNKRVHARQVRAEEMSDPIKAKYLRHNVEYVRDSHVYQEWFRWRAAGILQVAKPGAHLLSFGGTRMWHRMACAIEDAGFDVRDTMMWLYGCGFPKSHDVSKAIDRMAGVERVETNVRARSSVLGGRLHKDQIGSGGYGFGNEWGDSKPVTEAAKQWDGWGTSLKPAWEPIIVARRPPGGTVAQNTLEHGCGGINVDGCLVGQEGGTRAISGSTPDYLNNVYGTGMGGNPHDPNFVGGRWPANVILTHHPECRVVGKKVVRGHPGYPNGRGGEGWHGRESLSGNLQMPMEGIPDTEVDAYECHPDCPARLIDEQQDSASRFFYTAKANADDRPHGKGATLHPTVKPLDLMRYLVRLVCARGGTVLDPFMGSGSTGCAAIEEGCYFVGIEQSQEYADIAVGRLKLALQRIPARNRLSPIPLPTATATAPGQTTSTPPQPRRLRS